MIYQVMPDLSEDEYAELKSDIASRGVMVPIEFDEQGNVLDGHHRLQICEELNITDYPKVIRAGLTEEEKYTHARKLNLARRHLSQEQKRSLIQQQLQATPEKSDRQIAKDLGVSHHTVSTQRENLESIGQIAQCDRKTSDGRTYPKERKPVSVFNPTRREEKALTNPKVVEQVAISGSVMAAQKDIERAERQELIKEQIEKPKTSAHIDIFTTDKKYRVVYADPPWQYNDKQDTSKLGGAEKKYPTMPLKDICSLPVPTEDNAVLFLWVTSPMLEDAFQVIHAWGFSYKSSFIWDKVAHNMGHYNSVRHEFLLICTKGSCTPDVPKLLDSVVSIERTEHSVKPKEFRDMIDMLYPVGERLEMFARETAPGWDVWGNMA